MGLAEILTGLLAILVAVVPPLVTMLSKRAAERKKMGDGLQQVESDEADVARARVDALYRGVQSPADPK